MEGCGGDTYRLHILCPHCAGHFVNRTSAQFCLVIFLIRKLCEQLRLVYRNSFEGVCGNGALPRNVATPSASHCHSSLPSTRSRRAAEDLCLCWEKNECYSQGGAGECVDILMHTGKGGHFAVLALFFPLRQTEEGRLSMLEFLWTRNYNLCSKRQEDYTTF